MQGKNTSALGTYLRKVDAVWGNWKKSKNVFKRGKRMSWSSSVSYTHLDVYKRQARICLTHSFPVKDIEADIGKKDISAAQYAFIRDFLNGLDYDDYDKLIILCDRCV